MKALLTIAACRDVVERVKSVCIQLSCISAAGHPLHQAISLLFFCFSFSLESLIKKKCSVNVFLYPFVLFKIFWNTFLTSLVRFFFKIENFMVSFSCFYSHVSCPFSLLMFLSRGSDGRGRNTSPREMSEVSGDNGQQSLKVFCWRVFQHERRSQLMDLNQPRRMPWLMIFG